MKSPREDLLVVFQSGLDAVSGNKVVKKELATGKYTKYSHFIAIGKAAEAMLSGIPAEKIRSALLISKHGHIGKYFLNNNSVTCIESDHPIPKLASIEAGNTLIKYLENLPEKESVLFLISGGTSALVEVLQDGWDLIQLQALTDYLLANAYSIDEINTVRRRLSKIKGGGLWDYLGDRQVACLMISDVPDDDPAIIGSGLLFPSDEEGLPKLPKEWLENLSKNKKKLILKNFNWKIIASLDDAKNAAAEKAQELGYQTKIISDFLSGDAEKTAKSCVKTLQKNEGVLCILGGETTVKLPKNAGKGGRNQHLALSAAIEMDGLENIYLLAAGTDGSDGMTTSTGAIVDGSTVSHANQKKMKAADYLYKADSNSFFKATDSLITTGVTGTNVMDLVIGVCNQNSQA